MGIALYWHKQFRLQYDMLGDVISMAWVAWYERPTVKGDRRFDQVFNQVRRDIIHEIWHRGFHGGMITEEEPVYRGVIDQLHEPDLIGRVRLREITDICKREVRSDHISTIRVLAGLGKIKNRKKKKFNDRVWRLRKLLKKSGLAA